MLPRVGEKVMSPFGITIETDDHGADWECTCGAINHAKFIPAKMPNYTTWTIQHGENPEHLSPAFSNVEMTPRGRAGRWIDAVHARELAHP